LRRCIEEGGRGVDVDGSQRGPGEGDGRCGRCVNDPGNAVEQFGKCGVVSEVRGNELKIRVLCIQRSVVQVSGPDRVSACQQVGYNGSTYAA